MERLIEAHGLRRLALFWEILDLLVNAPEYEVLASLSFELDLTRIGDSGINRALSHLREHLTEQVEGLIWPRWSGKAPAHSPVPSSAIPGPRWCAIATSFASIWPARCC